MDGRPFWLPQKRPRMAAWVRSGLGRLPPAGQVGLWLPACFCSPRAKNGSHVFKKYFKKIKEEGATETVAYKIENIYKAALYGDRTAPRYSVVLRPPRP